jgi:uncharacterized protein (DUF302 family)
LLSVVFLVAAPSVAGEGLVTIGSSFDVKTTADRLEGVLQEKGMTVFSRIDHAAGARAAGKPLPPTELIIFGNPKVGTPLMQCQRTVAIDLPQKALIWEDDSRQVWLSYNDPAYLAGRHDIRGCDAVLEKIKTALERFASAAVSP